MAVGDEEISAIVLEVGTSSVKCGYSGQDTPRCVIPTNIAVALNGMETEDKLQGKHFGENAWLPRPNVEMKHPLENGLISDFDLYECLVENTFKNGMRINIEEFPLMLAEPSFNTPEQREKLAELYFEKFKVPGMYFGRQGVLSAFTSGKSTALVIDIGAGITSVTPVYDGNALMKGVIHQPFAGNAITEHTLNVLEKELKIPVVPTYAIAKKKRVEAEKPAEFTIKKMQDITKSFEYYQKLRLAEEFKEVVCEFSDTKFNEELLSLRPQKSFEFPSGYNGNFGLHRYKIPEILFKPDLLPENNNENIMGLIPLIQKAYNECDAEVRPHLLNNVVITGGTSLFSNFLERFHPEFTRNVPMKVKTHASAISTERKYAGWIGGSILASLGTFQQLWISKQEYEEEGLSCIEKRCQ